MLDVTGQEFVPTPTQDLILEVLAARWRLGETSWPFKKSPVVTRAIHVLTEHGFVWHKGAIASADYEQVGMTEMAVSEYCPKTYHAPSPPADGRIMVQTEWDYSDSSSCICCPGRHASYRSGYVTESSYKPVVGDSISDHVHRAISSFGDRAKIEISFRRVGS